MTAQAGWSKKSAEGKMFVRLECDDCHSSFHFGNAPRVTRVPVCPSCGSFASHPVAA